METRILTPSVTNLMEEGHGYLQLGDAATAYTAFMDALDSADPSDIRSLVEANQMLGVTARLTGDLDNASRYLSAALELIEANSIDEVLAGAVYRDMGAVHASLYLVYRTRFRGFERNTAFKSRDLARRSYEMSEQLLASSLIPSAVPELHSTKMFALMLEWYIADDLTDKIQSQEEKSHLSEQLEAQYRVLSHRISLDAAFKKRGVDIEKYKAHQANALIRVVRTEPLLQRLTHWNELMLLTDRDSPSPGSRTRALVALIFGDRVYSWFELRKPRQSR